MRASVRRPPMHSLSHPEDFQQAGVKGAVVERTRPTLRSQTSGREGREAKGSAVQIVREGRYREAGGDNEWCRWEGEKILRRMRSKVRHRLPQNPKTSLADWDGWGRLRGIPTPSPGHASRPSRFQIRPKTSAR